MTKRSLLLGALLISLFTGLAKADEWVFDPLHSKIEFTAASRLLKADGQFHQFTVKADVNEKALENSKMLVTIDVASLDTDNETRDEHLRDKDFFDVEAHPSATIEVKSIRKVSPTDYEASAAVTLHGATKTLTLPIKVTTFEGGVLRLRGTTELSRKEFGVGATVTGIVNAANPIEDLVTIRYEMDLRKPAPARQSSGAKAATTVR